MTEENIEEYDCEICDAKLSSIQDWELHMSKHSKKDQKDLADYYKHKPDHSIMTTTKLMKPSRPELKKIRIEYEDADGTMTTGECWIPKDGENPMGSIISHLELLTEDYIVEVTEIEE